MAKHPAHAAEIAHRFFHELEPVFDSLLDLAAARRPAQNQRRVTQPAGFIPALRFRSLTRFYDRVLATTLKEEKFKRLLVRQANLEPGQRLLDLGCGTATLTVLAKRVVPEVEAIGLDADAEALQIAKQKAAEAGVDVEWHQALAWEASFAAGSFDRIVSSLFFHHLRDADKARTLRTARGWLQPGGELHIADWGQAQDALMRLAFLGVQLLDGFETTSANVRGGLVPFLEEAGFAFAAETHRERTAFGTFSLYRAVAP